MKNLQEMSLQEMRETEGGFWGFLAGALFALVTWIIYDCVSE